MAISVDGFWTADLEGTVGRMNATLLITGTAAEIAAADAATYKRCLAWATDEQKLYYSTGSAWTAVAPGLNIAQTIAGVQTFSSIPVLPASDPTSDNQAVRMASRTVSKIVSGSRAYGSGSGDLAITGAGFAPKAVIINAYCDDLGGSGLHLCSFGHGDSSAREHCLYQLFTMTGLSASGISTGSIIYCISATYGWSGVLKTMDADGCTLTLTMGGDTTGTLYYEILFLG